jgi:hypothetical protein
VGLKDALATFHRRGIELTITSRHGSYSLQETTKHSFEGITTLHVAYDETPQDIEGTEFRLTGVTDEQMDEAKSFFLKFNGEQPVDATRYGDILWPTKDGGRVYISGVFASEEPNFLFSYNVTNLTDAMKKRLNRERLNVGRTTYTDRVKAILKDSTSPEVHEQLMDQVLDRGRAQMKDEMQWLEIVQMALTLVHENDDVLFVAEHELHTHPDVMDHARRDGLKIVIITNAEKKKLKEQAEAGGVKVRLLEEYILEFNESFEYRFVDPLDLEDAERAVYELTSEVLALVGAEKKAPKVLISETMRLDRDDTDGVWDPDLGSIVIKRDQLRSTRAYAATLLHEIAHAMTGTIDATREFENVLTGYLGRTSTAALELQSEG